MTDTLALSAANLELLLCLHGSLTSALVWILRVMELYSEKSHSHVAE